MLSLILIFTLIPTIVYGDINTSINKNQFREIVEDVLYYLDPDIPYSDAAVELIMLTAAQESELGNAIRQYNGGPALGILQMEPTTYYDIWNNYLRYKDKLNAKVKSLASERSMFSWTNYDEIPKDTELIGNMYFAIAMCRVHYYRVPHAIPENNVLYLARYYKKYYNTELGKATVEEAIEKYKRFAI